MTIGGLQDNIKYTATGPDGTIATFNDPTDANYIGMARLTGLDDPDIRETVQDRVESHGQLQFSNWRSGRAVVLNIEVVPSSTIDWNTKWDKLQRAFEALDADGQLVWTPDGSAQQGIRYRKNGPIRRSDDPGWLRKVQVPIKAADPLKYSTTLHSQSGLTASTVINNAGSAKSSPVVSLVSPAGTNSFSVFNQTTGEAVQIQNFVAGNYAVTWAMTAGSGGAGNGQFATPYDMAFDSSGNIFVTDGGNNRVQKFNSAGVYQSQFGSLGTGNGQFNSPRGIAIDASNNIFVADAGNNRIQKFNSAGTYQSQFGSAGTGDGQFNTPIGVAVSGSIVYVADYNNNRVQRIDWTGAPAFSAKFGTLGSGNGQFNHPVHLEVDSGGATWVTDYYNARVQKIINWSTTPAYSAQFGSAGSADGQFQTGPTGIAIDASNNMFVADYAAGRVQKFNSSGTFVAKFGTWGTANAQFAYPHGVALNSGATVLGVLDAGNVRFQTFAVSTTPTITIDLSVPSVKVAGTSIFQYVDLTSTSWWKLNPGNNSVLVTGASSASIDWRDAWL